VDPFERFSDEAKRTLTLTRAEAERSHSAYIGTEHILLGMLRTEGSLAATVLTSLGVDLAAARAAIGSIPRRPDQPLSAGGGGAPTSRVRRVVELAFQEARGRGDTTVTTGSMLVGLLLVADGAAAEILRGGGVSVAAVREALARLGERGVGETVSGGRPEGAARTAPSGSQASGAVPVEAAPPSVPSPPPAPEGSELRRLLDSAERDAAAMGTTPGPDHVLRALLSHDGFTARLLARLGVDRAEALRLATPPGDARELGDEVRRLRSEQGRALAAGDEERAAAARGREGELLRLLADRLSRWRETFE
jgi:ATP-dependent Clp protease ATP-binding subunit ClpA